MNTPTRELELLRHHDPAAELNPDPESLEALAIRSRALEADSTDASASRPRAGRRVPRRVAVGVAVLSIVTGATAIAQVGPFANEWEACHAAPGEAGREVPYPECAEFVSERVQSEIETDGSDFERQVLADGIVTRAEYDEAAQRTAACIQDGFDEAGLEGVEATAAESSWQLGFRYSFRISYPDGVDPDSLPWSSDAAPAEATGDSDTVHPATELTDDMVQSDPTLRCPAEHYERIDRVWEAQQIAGQNS